MLNYVNLFQSSDDSVQLAVFAVVNMLAIMPMCCCDLYIHYKALLTALSNLYFFRKTLVFKTSTILGLKTCNIARSMSECLAQN